MCRFRVRILDDGARIEIPEIARQLAFSIRPSLVREYWDCPIALYELAVEHQSATNLGISAQRQERQPHPEKKRRDEVRERYYRQFGLPKFPGE
jgi:hypothetical protein